MKDVDFQDLMRLYQSLKENGALEREDAIILIGLIKQTIRALRPSVKKGWLIIALAGVEKVLEETKEHLESLEE